MMNRRVFLACIPATVLLAKSTHQAWACAAGPFPPSIYMPTSLRGFTIVSDAVRDAEDLIAYFWDPEATRVRLDAWGWVEQAEREFASEVGDLLVAVSIHSFETDGGAQLGSTWFRERRMEDLDLALTRAPELTYPRSEARVNLLAVENADEYSLYMLFAGSMAARITVTGTTDESEREALALRAAREVLLGPRLPHKG